MKALVTGASRGLGRELALGLHRRGDDVLVLSRSPAPGPVDGRWRWFECDLGRDADVAAAVAEARSFAPEILIHAAATAPVAPTPEAVTTTLAVNFAAAVHLCRAVVPSMAERREGAVVLVSSLAALAPIDGFGVYGASKAALDAYAASLRAEYAASGVKVLLARPGRMATDFFAANGFAEDVIGRARSFAAPAEAAQAILARIGNDGEYVHGGDRWLVRARRRLPRQLGELVWQRLT